MTDEKVVNEIGIRNFLKTLTIADIADSTYLFGIDFDIAPIDDILDSIIALYDNVKVLREMVSNNFKSGVGPKILMPQVPETQGIVLTDYYEKGAVLLKLFSNEDIKSAVDCKIGQRQEKMGHAKK